MQTARVLHVKASTSDYFGGQPSIPYKWEIAQYIGERAQYYDKSALVLYFGDLDEAGHTIFEAGRRDITKWCAVPIEFIRGGLTEEQQQRYGVPENLDHPGYQWEALTDEQAREIIMDALEPYFDMGAVDRAELEGRELSLKIQEAVNERIADST